MTAAGPGRAAERIAESEYGYFDGATREFVITRPDTPTPWLNYLGAGGYGGIVSNTAGGFSFDRDPRNRRLTRYRYNGVPADQPGRYVYLRDMDGGDYWSPTWQPVKRALEAYECRHGAGYSRIRSAYRGIEADILYFVPPGSPDEPCPCELWVMTVRNAGPVSRRLRSFSYAEFGFPDAFNDQHNLDWGQHIVAARYEGGTILVATRFRPTTAFFAASQPAVGYSGNREAFLGRAGELRAPATVVDGEPTNEGSPRGNAIGSLCHDLELAPGEERTIVYIMGITDRPAEIPLVVARFGDPRQVDAAFAALQADWDAYLSRFTVATADPAMDAMLNVWNPIQCRTTLYWSRFVSGYETGLGRGMGTRDSAQDTLGTVHAVPAHARRTLLRLWQLQFSDGHAWHQFFPLTGEGGAGLAVEYPDYPQWFSDDHLWLVIASCAYLRETGELGYLDERPGYADGGEGTVWDHIERAVAFSLAHRGPHGLPRAGFADWDDTLNVDHGSGRAESVWTAMQFCRAALDLAELSDSLGRAADAGRFRGLKTEMAARINDCAWDGAWFARAFDDAGRPIGVAGEAHHAINVNTQTWAVLGEVAERARAEQAIESARQRLDTPFGMALLWPPYDGGDDRVHGTATYPPGAKENGGIFCHANTWLVVAAAMLGRGDEAYRYYRQILPLGRTDPDRYMAEPYVYAQNICGPSHPQFGLARNAWLTGTASWTYVAATQWILGIRPTYGGLRVAPAMPSSWSGFRAHREFRGIAYEIVVRRVGPGTSLTLRVDGRPIEGDVVPLPAGGGPVSVEAILG